MGAPNLLVHSGQQIISQVDAMNMGFAETGLNFVLAGVDRTINPDWFANAGPDTCVASRDTSIHPLLTSPNSAQQTAMKRSLRLGTRSDLNVYTVG